MPHVIHLIQKTTLQLLTLVTQVAGVHQAAVRLIAWKSNIRWLLPAS